MPILEKRTAPVWLIGAATAFSLLGDQTLYSTLPVLFDELGLRPFEVGIILSANRWIRLGTNELAHRLTGRADQRLLFTGALGLGAATTAVYAATPGFAVFLLARVTWGLCWSFIRHLGTLSVMAVSDGHRSGFAAGRLSGIARVGSVGGLFGGALLVDAVGFPAALAIMAGLSALAVPLATVGFVPTGPAQSSARADGRGNLVAAGLGLAHGMVGPGLVLATLGAVLQERLGEGSWLSAATLTGAVLAFRFVLEGAAAARLGAISDSHGIRMTSSVGFVVGATALVVATASPSLPLLLLAVVVFFIAGTTLGAGLVGFVGAQGSRTLSRYATATDLGAAAGPLIGWIALGLFDRRSLGLAMGAAVYGLAAIAAWYGLRSTADG